MDEKVTKNPTCVDMDNVWWSLFLTLVILHCLFLTTLGYMCKIGLACTSILCVRSIHVYASKYKCYLLGVVLTIIVHPTMMGGPWTLLYGYLKVLWGDTMSGIFKALVAS
jgi:hypothetical protein